MTKKSFQTQIQLMAYHLKEVGAINPDQARKNYAIVEYSLDKKNAE